MQRQGVSGFSRTRVNRGILQHTAFMSFDIGKFYLILKAPRNTYSRWHSIFFFSKLSFEIACELSAKQKIYMEYQDLLSLKKKKRKYFKMQYAAGVIGA